VTTGARSGDFSYSIPICFALRALIATTLDRYEARLGDSEALMALDFQTAVALLKVDASELAVETVTAAMRACGLTGYRNDS